MLFDPTEPDVEMADFQREDWSIRIYVDVKEEMLTIVSFSESGANDMPEPHGQGFTMTVYVECDIDGDCVTVYQEHDYIYFSMEPLPTGEVQKKRVVK